MKSRLSAPSFPIPQLALYYGLAPQDEARLLELLQAQQLTARRIETTQVDETLGCLAGFPGFAPSKAPSNEAAAPAVSCLVLCGLSDERLDALLAALANGPKIPLKAVVTPHNQSWSFVKLIGQLQAEHDYYARRARRS